MFSKFAEDWWIWCAQIYKSYLHIHFASLSCTNLQILNAWSFFCFSQLVGNITIRGNCCLQIYKSYMDKHFCFCSLTKFWYKCCVRTYWSCIHKCIGTCSKIYNQIVNCLTDNCLYTDKKNLATWFSLNCNILCPLPACNNVDEIPNKTKWKIYAFFTLYVKYWSYPLKELLI